MQTLKLSRPFGPSRSACASPSSVQRSFSTSSEEGKTSYDPRSASIRAAAAVLLLSLAPFQVSAQVAARDAAFDRFLLQATGVGQYTVGFSGGTPAVVTAPATLQTTGAQAAEATRSIRMTNPSGQPFNLQGRWNVPPSKFGPLLIKGLKAAPVLGTGIALYELAQELGFTPSKDPSGNLLITQPGLATDLWRVMTNTSGSSTLIRASSEGDACVKNGHIWTPNPYQPGKMMCQITPMYVYTPIKQANTTLPGTAEPRTEQELADAIAAKSGWPQSSKLAPAIAQALDLLPAEKLAPDAPPTITGPASTPGPTTTKTNPDGTTETKTTVHNHTYQGNTITTVTVTTTNIYNPTTGTTDTTTETSEPTNEEQPEPDQCETNPNSLACAELDTPSGEIPRSSVAVSFSPLNLFGAGSCPADRTWVSVQTGATHTLTYEAACDALDLLRPMFIAIAFFIGYMIVLPRSN